MSRFSAGLVSTFTGGNDSYTKSLLHMDGPNGGTSFPDTNFGGSAKTWTATSAFTYTGNFKFGGASFINSTTGYITTPDHADFTLGTNDFSIDFWIGTGTTSAPSMNVMGQLDSSGTVSSASVVFFTDASSHVQFICVVGSTAYTVTSTSTVPISLGPMAHVAGVRVGNVLKLFWNGVQEGGDVAISGAINDSSTNWSIGRAGDRAAANFIGEIDEFRFSNGIARYTANFTPPTQAYF